jgi:hypothetical protein
VGENSWGRPDARGLSRPKNVLSIHSQKGSPRPASLAEAKGTNAKATLVDAMADMSDLLAVAPYGAVTIDAAGSGWFGR